MPELNDHIANVQAKLQQLLKQYDFLLKENDKQQQLIAALQKEQVADREQLETLQQQNLVLKASVSDMDPADKKELEQKLNQYIKNIDKCISLLSQ
jgi:chromosome segregation ATPase